MTIQLALELPDELNAKRLELLSRLFRRLQHGLNACRKLEFWACVSDIEIWAHESLEAKRKIETAMTMDELNQLQYDLALTNDFMLPDELE